MLALDHYSLTSVWGRGGRESLAYETRRSLHTLVCSFWHGTMHYNNIMALSRISSTLLCFFAIRTLLCTDTLSHSGTLLCTDTLSHSGMLLCTDTLSHSGTLLCTDTLSHSGTLLCTSIASHSGTLLSSNYRAILARYCARTH